MEKQIDRRSTYRVMITSTDSEQIISFRTKSQQQAQQKTKQNAPTPQKKR